MLQDTTKKLIEFLKKSPTAFHAVAAIKEELDAAGFQELSETESWQLLPGEKYYVTRNCSSIIGFQIGTHLEDYSFQISASHTDSPGFKIKENAEIRVRDHYLQLNTEGYGGMICSAWFDRPLSVAGRVLVSTEKGLETRLLKIDKDLVMIPNLAIHMNRSVNEGYAYNKQVDLLPLLGGKEALPGDFRKLIAQELSVKEEEIYGSDLYLYNRMEPSVWGMKQEFLSGPQLDDLQCAYGTLQGFLRGKQKETIGVFACLDNEEVGSSTKQGAASTFLCDVLKRINGALGKTKEDYYRALGSSFLVSADNAHAVHPNHPEKTDVSNCVYMNEGIVIKSHGGQKYTSDGVSIGIFKKICEKAQVPVQFFANRSDQTGGSTLGNISSGQVSVNAVDIGLPQLAMHSPYETAGVKDLEYLIRGMEAFYNTKIHGEKDGNYRIC